MESRVGEPHLDPGRFSPKPRGIALYATRAIRLLEAMPAPIGCVVLEAPPGYGKSSVLELLFRARTRCANSAVWLTLENSESRLEDLIRLLCAALGQEASHLSALLAQPAELGRATAALLSSIRPMPEIFLDDMECCLDPGLGAFLDALIGSFRGGGIWLATTRRPGFDYTRHIAAGRLRCLRMHELSFTAADTAAILNARCPMDWKPTWLDQIQARTQGLPIAVSLLAAVLQTSPDVHEVIRQFKGRDITLVSFLHAAWFDSLDEELKQFLRMVAWLDPIDAELCGVAVDMPGTARLLDRLVEDNCYLQPLDRNGHSFRLQPLVREFLQAEALRDTNFEPFQRMLLRAVEWTKQHGRSDEAVEYALAARSIDTVAALLHEIAPSWVGRKGELLRYIRWVESARTLGTSLTL